MMSMELYQDILSTIKSSPRLRDIQPILEEKYPHVSTLSLGSILSNHVTRLMKASHSKHNNPAGISAVYAKYSSAVSAKEAPGILLRLSDELQICPVLVARWALEAFLHAEQETEMAKYNKESAEKSGGAGASTSATAGAVDFTGTANAAVIRSEVSSLLRDTTLISDRNLAYEVYLCTVHDDHYGPIPDSIKSTIGSEYESILKEKLTGLRVSFVDESVLRRQGYDKTPDFKLDVPIAIKNTGTGAGTPALINWIESKATFGDEETHDAYLNDQLMSYWNRFGPGLVIYWLGHVESLQGRTIKGILVRDALPEAEDIIFMDPNGNGPSEITVEQQQETQNVNVNNKAVKLLQFDGTAASSKTKPSSPSSSANANT